MTFDSRWKNPQGSDPKQLYLWAQEIIKELRKGDYLPDVTSLAASAITYDNATSGLTADDAQAAIDEVEGRVDVLEAAPAGLVLLASDTVSAQATLDIPLTAYAGYRALKFVLSGFVPATDDVELWMRFSTDGGANYDATGYAWVWTGNRDGSATPVGEVDADDTEIVIAGRGPTASQAISNVAGEGGADAEITLHGFVDAGRYSRVRFSSAWTSADAQIIAAHGAGMRETAQNTDAVRFLFEGGGDIASGNWAVYGLA